MKHPLILMSVVFLSLPIPIDHPTNSGMDDLKLRVKKLETKQEQLISELATLTQRNDALMAWAKTLPTLCEKLDSRMDSSRKNGFEYAGAHPKAKADILDGLKDFAVGQTQGLKLRSKPPK